MLVQFRYLSLAGCHKILLPRKNIFYFALTYSNTRVPADADEVSLYKSRIDRWEVPTSSNMDAHVPAAVLKHWYRELCDPLIPHSLYNDCVEFEGDIEKAKSIV